MVCVATWGGGTGTGWVRGPAELRRAGRRQKTTDVLCTRCRCEPPHRAARQRGGSLSDMDLLFAALCAATLATARANLSLVSHARHVAPRKGHARNATTSELVHDLYGTDTSIGAAEPGPYDLRVYSNAYYVTPAFVNAPDAPACLRGNASNGVAMNQVLQHLVFAADLTHEERSTWATYSVTGDISCIGTIVNAATMAAAVRHSDVSKALMVTVWMPSWGHLVDTFTVLVDVFYRHKLNELGYKVVVDVPTDVPWCANVLLFVGKLLGDRFVNIHGATGVVAFDEIIFVQNVVGLRSFHSFPDAAIQLLHSRWDGTPPSNATFAELRPAHVFLTRGKPATNRFLANHDAVEAFFRAHGVHVINPEAVSNVDLYHTLKHAKTVISTAGSAMTTLMLAAQPSSRWFCLRSQSYQPEWRLNVTSEADMPPNAGALPDFEKELWAKATSKRDFHYVNSFNNTITDAQLEDIMVNLK